MKIERYGRVFWAEQVCPPYDTSWSIVADGYDGGDIDIDQRSDDCIGTGDTIDEALADLLEQENEG